MPITNGQRINMFTRRVLGSIGLGTRLLDYLEDGIQRHTKAMTTGETPSDDVGAWFAAVTVGDGTGTHNLDFGNMYGVDGRGNMISEQAGTTYLDEVPFEDTAATTYYMAATTGFIPKAVLVNQSSGEPEYDYTELELAHVAAPSAVVNGGAFLTITLGNHQLSGSDDFSGRTAMVWLVDPASPDAATAIETVVITGGNQVVTSGVLGQTSPSTTPSNYRVAILGPTITRSNTVQSLAGFAYIGTVVGGGAPRTYVTSGQTILVPLSEVSGMFDDLLEKGWVDVPSYTNTGTQVQFTTTGEAYISGRLKVAPTQTVSGWGYTSSNVWLYWSPISGQYKYTDSWDTANQTGNVPIVHFLVDGGGNITGSVTTIGRRVRAFNRPMVLQVSPNAVHRTAYRTLEAALARVSSIREGSNGERAIIELLDDITIGATISAPIHFPANVTFRGMGVGGPSALGLIVGSYSSHTTIKWAMDDAVFDIPDGSGVIGWTFEGIAFQYTGTSTQDDSAIIRALTNNPAEARTITNLSFIGCVFDFSTQAAGTPYPGVVYNIGTDADGMDSIHLYDCFTWGVQGAHVWSTADVSDLRIKGCTGSQGSTTIPGANPGGIAYINAALSNSFIQDNQLTQINAWALFALGAADVWITDNELDLVPDNDCSAIELGDNTTDTYNLHLDHNRIKVTYSGTLTEPVVHLKPDTAPIIPGLSGNDIWVTNNTIYGDDESSSGLTGLLIDSGTADTEVFFIQGNHIAEVNIGIELTQNTGGGGSHFAAVISGNVIRAGAYSIDTNDADQVVIFGNILLGDDTNHICISSAGLQHLIAANILDGAGGTDIGVEARTGADYWVVMGNLGAGLSNMLFDGVQTNTSILLGNNGGASAGVDWSSNDGVMVGNIVGGTLDFGGGLRAVCLGNTVDGATTIDAGDSVIVGNVFDSTLATECDGVALTGNAITGAASINDTSGTEDDNVLVGNFFKSTLAIDGDNNVLTGNRVVGNMSTAAAADETTIVGNKYNGAGFTDNGTNTFTGSNNTV